MNRFQELINMSDAELLSELTKIVSELHELRMGNKLRQLKETHKIRLARRYLAQIKTALKYVKLHSNKSEEKPATEEKGKKEIVASEKKEKPVKEKPLATKVKQVKKITKRSKS